MNSFNTKLRQKFQKRKAIKIITGLNNFEVTSIIKKVKAAEIGGATYVDIAANTDIVKIVKSITKLPICVSSIDPLELYKCYLAGADIVEIGNFDIFYKKKIYFSFKQIINIAKEVIFLLGTENICITIPHTLLLDEQIQLGLELKEIGISLLQTEGISTSNKHYPNDSSKIFKSINKASSALSSSYAMSNNLDLSIIASSGINSLSAAIAVYYGASAVGIGSSINSSLFIHQQAQYVNEIVQSISCQKEYTSIRSLNFKMYKINAYLTNSIIL